VFVSIMGLYLELWILSMLLWLLFFPCAMTWQNLFKLNYLFYWNFIVGYVYKFIFTFHLWTRCELQDEQTNKVQWVICQWGSLVLNYVLGYNHKVRMLFCMLFEMHMVKLPNLRFVCWCQVCNFFLLHELC